MRRRDREITDIQDKLAVIDTCKVCRLALCDNGQPYIVPLNFGYTFTDNTLTLYFHSAHEGRKMDIIKSNNRACFEIDTEHALIEGSTACSYGFAFASVIGFGVIEFITDKEEKIKALNTLMTHQTGKDMPFMFNEAELHAVTVYKLIVREFTGKRKTIKPHV